MKINHLIIGCEDIKKSSEFYEGIIGLTFFNSFIDTGTKKEGKVYLHQDGDHEFEILLVPFNEERLPSPQHLAFELNINEFQRIYNRAVEQGLDIRAMPPLDCKIKGIGKTEIRNRLYERFYLLDPNRVNIEFMRLC